MRYSEEQIREVSEALDAEQCLATHKRLQILLWRMEGKSGKEVAALSGADRTTIWRICDSYKQHGLAGVPYRYKGGNRRKLTVKKESEILQALSEQAEGGQFVRSYELQAEFEKRANKQYDSSTFSRLLQRHNWRKVVPRGRHPKAADEATCEAAKKLTFR
jgi:transposase